MEMSGTVCVFVGVGVEERVSRQVCGVKWSCSKVEWVE